MEPKFQSSFIPKGPIATNGTATKISRESHRTLIGTLAIFVLSLTLLAGGGVFGYEWYLNLNIEKMGKDLEAARSTLKPEAITQVSNLSDRLASTRELLEKHSVITPILEFLEENTLKTVRFGNFDFRVSPEDGPVLEMKGLARGYNALALQAEIFQDASVFKQPVFRDLDLDDKGNVTFSFSAKVDSKILSFKELVAPAQASSEPQ